MPLVTTPLPDLDEPERGDVIVLADASVEGEDIASLLRARGFIVFDVPLALLEARVASEEPRIIILDIDQQGAIEKAKRVRETGVGRRAQIFCLGDSLRAAELADVSLLDNVFERPVDVPRLVDRALSVAVPSAAGFAIRGTTPPPMYASRPSAMPPGESIPPISEFPRAHDPLEVGSFLEDGADPAATLGLLAGGQVRLSPELARQIFEAEQRIRPQVESTSSVPSPSEDGDCAVPPEMLAHLDELLDGTDDLEGTGGIAAALAQAGSSGGTGGSSTGLPAALTPMPRVAGALTPPPETQALAPSPPRSRSGATGVERSAATGVEAADASPSGVPAAIGTSVEFPAIVPPASTALPAPPRAGSPALGLRLGELLGIRVEDSKRPADSGYRGLGPTSFSADSTQRGEDAFSPPSNEAMSASPLSPPVRFQEPRALAEGRALFDLRTIPPRDPGRGPAHEVRPLIIPAASSGTASSGSGRPSTERDEGGVSPAAQSVRPSHEPLAGAVFAEMDGIKPLARAIAARKTGCLSLTTAEGVRRIVLVDGDLVTAASEIADESLVAFLAARGDFDREAAARLAGKLPASGRHAGAALIAQGFLAQSDLWPVLRAHAEWLIGRILLGGPGATELDDDLPGRLKAEPNVFGGATGAEVLIETARRVLDPSRALAALGGGAARLDLGPRQNLLSECALSPSEDALIRGASGKTVSELCGEQTEMASALRALVELEIIGILAPVQRAPERQHAEPDPFDEEAIRQKVRAKMVLVQEGDYFALLGVNRTATAYEVKRAFLELRRTFEPSRLLTAKTTELHDDVQLIVEVLEEAFDILRDNHRRERYRRAIEAGPPE